MFDDDTFPARNGAAGGNEQEIRQLFRRWLEALRGGNRPGLSDEEREPFFDEENRLSLRIAEYPPVGPIGLAIKLYAATQWSCGGVSGSDGDTNLDPNVTWGYEELIKGAAIAEAVRILPELEPRAELYLAAWREQMAALYDDEPIKRDDVRS
jgi:hypothetical protein